ncbi:MAG: nucleotide exchange factor GrpE [Prevotella sp.]|nr:nucleotide exchange factor GrpE [Prevotella sp.]
MEEEKVNKEEEESKDIPVEEGKEASAAEEDVQDNGEEAQQDSQEESKDPLDVALEEIASLKDRYQRLAAEFDNYRKRTIKERAELILNGGEKTIKALLPVIDDMERAMANGEKTDDPKVLREGMELIYHKLMKTLEGMGVKKIDTENADFDTDIHEAIAMVAGMGDDKKGKVIDCMTTGYKLNDKVIRHAKVTVGQ